MSDLILTAYLTSRADPQRRQRVPADSFAYMRPWYRSMTRLGLTGLVVHDGLSPAFVERYTTSRIGFVRTRPGPWTTNDARFFAYQRLLARVRAARVFLTDISDVTIVQDPFAGLERLDADLVAGNEIYPREGDQIARHPWLMQRIRETRSSGSREVFEFFRARRFAGATVNAGVIGGEVRAVRRLLREFVRVRTAVGHSERNLNMAIVNYVVHRVFEGRAHLGAPVTSVFKGYERRRRDVWFIHK